MVKTAIKRLVLRYFPELGERKHLPQLARIEAIYDLPTNGAKISTPFRPYKAADIQLLNPHTCEPLNVPIFQQVTIATGQSHDSGLINEPQPGMHCLIQYIDGLNSLQVITSILPWQSLVPEYKHTDVSLKQNSRSQIKGSNGNWDIQTDGQINQQCDESNVEARSRTEQFTERQTTIQSHDNVKIDGNQIAEVMGALKTIVGEKALIAALEGLELGSQKHINVKAHENINIDTLKTLHAKASELAKVEGSTVWLGDNSVNALQILADLIKVVSDTNKTLAAHIHPPGEPPAQKGDFTGYKSKSDALKSKLDPIVG
jgi:hypothetical protein